MISCDCSTGLGQDVDVVVRRGRTLVGDILLHLQSSHQRLDHAERQLHLIRDLAAFAFANILHVPINDRLQKRFIDASGFHVIRFSLDAKARRDKA